MSSPVIRLADYSEMPDIIEILEELGLDMEDLDEDDWMLAHINGEVVGVGRLRYYEDACELASLGVLEEHRGKHIGKSIAKALLDDAEADNVFVVTDISEYFKSLGFQELDTYPQSIQEKYDRCLSELQCQAPKVLVNLIKKS